MNANRNLIYGIALSLFVHGAFLGIPISPEGQRRILPHQPTPLEISLVKLKAHEDAPPKKKLLPQVQPQRVRHRVTVTKKKVTKRREKSKAVVEEKPIPVSGEKAIASPKKEKIPAPAPKPSILVPQREITREAPQPEEVAEKKSPPLVSSSPSANRPLEGEDLRPSLIPKTGSSPITLARPRYDRNPKPPYPRVARRKGYQGVVVLKVEILPNGRVGELRVKKSSGHPVLDRSALKTVRKWRFIPAKRRGEPIRIWVEIPIKFKLQ